MLLRMIPVFIIQSVLQEASLINQNRKSYFNDYLSKFYVKGLLFTFSIGLSVTLFSKWIIIFLSGSEIVYSQEVLSLLSFIPFLAMLNFKNIIKILVEEKKRILNKATWITVFFYDFFINYYEFLFWRKRFSNCFTAFRAHKFHYSLNFIRQ